MIAVYLVNRKEKLLLLIMSTGKENAVVKRGKQRRAQQEDHLKELSEIMQ